jgi:radical SAM protein with 4Fe4S-binding SPASM domain
MSSDEIFEVIDQLGDLGVSSIYLFGGEPTLRKDIFKIIKRCKANGIYTEMVTNGATLSDRERAEELIYSGIDKICISLDGLENEHDQLRGKKGSFNLALKSITEIIAARNRNKKITPLVEVGHTISKGNFKKTEDLVQFLNGMGLFEIKLRHMGVFSREDIENANNVMQEIGVDFPPLFSTGQDIMMSPKDIVELRHTLKELEREYKKGALDLIPHIEPTLYDVDDWRKGREISSCLHIWTQIAINAFGQMVPCIWYDGMDLGDVRGGKLLEAWNGRKAKYFRKNYLKLSGCRQCCYFYLSFWENLKRAFQVPFFPFKNLLAFPKGDLHEKKFMKKNTLK